MWEDDQGRNRCGTVVIQEQQFFAAREVAKVDARPGGYVATGGHGGIIGQITHRGAMHLTYLPAYKHTYKSELRLPLLPASVKAAHKTKSGIELIDVAVKDAGGKLLGRRDPGRLHHEGRQLLRDSSSATIPSSRST